MELRQNFWLIVFISHILSEYLLNESKKVYSTENDDYKVIFSSSKVFAFFSDSYIWRKPMQWYVNFWLGTRCCIVSYINITHDLNINRINIQLIWNNQIGKPQINGLFIATLNYSLFHFYFFSVLLSSYYIHANLLTYRRCWLMKIKLLSALMYLIRLSLMKFQVCYNFVSFLIFKIVIKCRE